MLRWTCVLAATLLCPAAARAETLEEQVNRAIERGIVAARASLGADGAGTTKYHSAFPEGDTSLLLYTLVKSGVSADDPQVRRAVDWLRYRGFSKTYSTGIYAMALDSFKDHQFDSQIREAATWLEVGMQSASHRWAYPDKVDDLSNTQYAVLGLWTAERHGFKAKSGTWTQVADGVLELQKINGSFGYHGDSQETGSMTVAGLTVLSIALDRVPADSKKRIRAAIERGWAWFEKNFTVEGVPLGPSARSRDYVYYYLYGIERLAAIAQREKIGSHDWYAEGARQLLAWQQDDGGWGEPTDTCFALLFLRRATFTSMGGAAKAITGDAAAARPTKPAEACRWIRRWLALPPAVDPSDALFDSPPFRLATAAPTANSVSARTKWLPVASRDRWVRLGDPKKPLDRSVAWAFTYLSATTETDAVLWFGNDDGIEALLDGTVVLAHHFHDADPADSNSASVHLTPGMHRLLVQLENWGGLTQFCLRLAHRDGSPCPEVRPSLKPDASDVDESMQAQPGLFAREDLLHLLPRDPRLTLSFDTEDQVDRLALDGDSEAMPRWVLRAEDAGKQGPNPGAKGLLGLHPESRERPSTATWRVQIPNGKPRIRVRASCCPLDATCDGVFSILVFDGRLSTALCAVVGPDARPDPGNWRWLEADLTAWAGRDVLVVLQSSAGGAVPWCMEYLWIDAVEIVGGG